MNRTTGRSGGARRAASTLTRAAALVATVALVGCEQEELRVPTTQDLAGYYSYSGDLTRRMNGNVAEIVVVQPTSQLRRGGSLWARVGPYIFAFSPDTRALFNEYSGLAGVRVITQDGIGREVARVLLERSTLNDITWPRALNVAAVARRDGTSSPSRLEDLVRFGEQNTRFSYSDTYVAR